MDDLTMEWTKFSVSVEVERFGLSRLVKAHNELRAEVMKLREDNAKQQELIEAVRFGS